MTLSLSFNYPPVLCITDCFFFGTLHEGWLRHGVAEIIKIATVKNDELFADLNRAQPDLVATRFETIGCDADGAVTRLSQKILGGAMRSYIEAEYDNLYKTHRCRPHVYGRTWSPGFEIEAGLLHGHAVAIDMGFGAYLRLRAEPLAQHAKRRPYDGRKPREDHAKARRKSGRTDPEGQHRALRYLNDLSRFALSSALHKYQAICTSYPRAGHGIDLLCSDVVLEAPSTVGTQEGVLAFHETSWLLPLHPIAETRSTAHAR